MLICLQVQWTAGQIAGRDTTQLQRVLVTAQINAAVKNSEYVAAPGGKRTTGCSTTGLCGKHTG